MVEGRAEIMLSGIFIGFVSSLVAIRVFKRRK